MGNTIKIARVLSAYLVVTGVGFLISGDFYARLIARTDSDPVLINLSGMVHFFIGSTLLTYHFLWRTPMQIAVSLLAFLFIVKGVSLIALPDLILQTGNNPGQKPWLMAIGFLLAGLVLGYFSFSSNEKKSG